MLLHTHSGPVGLAKQLVGALGPISKGEVVMWEPEAEGEGRECVIGGYFSAATALGAGGQHVRGGGGGSPQQMALDKGGGSGHLHLEPHVSSSPLAQRKRWGEGKGCLYSKRRISTHPHPPIHRLEPRKKAAGKARGAKVRTASNSHHLPLILRILEDLGLRGAPSR